MFPIQNAIKTLWPRFLIKTPLGMGSWHMAHWVQEFAGLFPFVTDSHASLSELIAVHQAESYYQAALSKPQLQVELRFFYNACLSNLTNRYIQPRLSCFSPQT